MSNQTQQAAQNVADAEMAKLRPTEGTFELPAGYLDGEGTRHVEVTLTAMTGRDEDILAGNGAFHQRLTRVFTNRVVQLGEVPRQFIPQAIESLTVADRSFLIIALRRVTHGNRLPIAVECPDPDCEHSRVVTYDLSTLDVVPMPEPEKRQHIVELPSGRAATWHVMTARRAARDSEFDRLAKRMRISAAPLTKSLAMRVDEIDGEPATLDVVQSLPMVDRDYLMAQYEYHEGGIDTELLVSCGACKLEWSIDLDIGDRGFFYPLAFIRAWNKKHGSSYALEDLESLT